MLKTQTSARTGIRTLLVIWVFTEVQTQDWNSINYLLSLLSFLWDSNAERERDRESTICLAGPRVGKALWWTYSYDFIHGAWGGVSKGNRKLLPEGQGKTQQIPYGQYRSPPHILGRVITIVCPHTLIALDSWHSPQFFPTLSTTGLPTPPKKDFKILVQLWEDCALSSYLG